MPTQADKVSGMIAWYLFCVLFCDQGEHIFQHCCHRGFGQRSPGESLAKQVHAIELQKTVQGFTVLFQTAKLGLTKQNERDMHFPPIFMMEGIDILDLAIDLISWEGPEAHHEGHPSSSFSEIQTCKAHLSACPGEGCSYGNQ